MRLPVHNSSSGRNNIKVMIVAALFLSLLLPLGQKKRSHDHDFDVVPAG